LLAKGNRTLTETMWASFCSLRRAIGSWDKPGSERFQAVRER
jgi:hypothetical protein